MTIGPEAKVVRVGDATTQIGDLRPRERSMC